MIDVIIMVSFNFFLITIVLDRKLMMEVLQMMIPRTPRTKILPLMMFWMDW